MRKNNMLLLLLLLMGSTWFPCTGQIKIEFQEYDLSNGLHVILYPRPDVPVVAVGMMYHVGSKNEDPQRTGFAHFFEHLMFEGSKYIERGELDKLLTEAGATYNANTWYDRTYYYEVLPANQLNLALWIEAERLRHAKVDKKGIETQREVVKEERRLRVDNQPYGRLVEETMKRMYKKHPYRWPVIGYMEHLEAASEGDFKDFYKTFYVPNNATLAVAGNFDPETVKRTIDIYFGDIPKGKKVPRPQVEEPPLGGEVREVVYDNVQLPAVVHAFRTPSIKEPDYYAVNMLMQLLSQGESSRLSRYVKNEKRKALVVGAFPFGLEDSPSVSIIFGIANAGVSPEELEAAMEEEYEKIKKEGISFQEFQKLRNQLETEFYTRNSTMEGIAESLANYHTFFGDANLINTEIQQYLKVTPADIKRVANQYLVKENRVTLYWLPKSKEQSK